MEKESFFSLTDSTVRETPPGICAATGTPNHSPATGNYWRQRAAFGAMATGVASYYLWKAVLRKKLLGFDQSTFISSGVTELKLVNYSAEQAVAAEQLLGTWSAGLKLSPFSSVTYDLGEGDDAFLRSVVRTAFAQAKVPCVAERCLVLLGEGEAAEEPDPFMSVDAIAKAMTGKQISLICILALTVNGKQVHFFRSQLVGSVRPLQGGESLTSIVDLFQPTNLTFKKQRHDMNVHIPKDFLSAAERKHETTPEIAKAWRAAEEKRLPTTELFFEPKWEAYLQLGYFLMYAAREAQACYESGFSEYIYLAPRWLQPKLHRICEFFSGSNAESTDDVDGVFGRTDSQDNVERDAHGDAMMNAESPPRSPRRRGGEGHSAAAGTGTNGHNNTNAPGNTTAPSSTKTKAKKAMALNGRFENHITVNIHSQAEANTFVEAMYALRIKVVSIQLPRGSLYPEQMMTSYYTMGNVLECARVLFEQGRILALLGFEPTRMKMELQLSENLKAPFFVQPGTNIGICPLSDSDAKNSQVMSSSQYFEFHLKLHIPEESAEKCLKELREVGQKHGAHLSRNAFKCYADLSGETPQTSPSRPLSCDPGAPLLSYFLTLRNYHLGFETALKLAHAMRKDASEVTARYDGSGDSLQREFSVFDTNLLLDKGWIDGVKDSITPSFSAGVPLSPPPPSSTGEDSTR